MEPARKHYFARIPTIALFVLFAMSPWVGIILWILKRIDREIERKEEAAARAQRDYTADSVPQRPGNRRRSGRRKKPSTVMIVPPRSRSAPNSGKRR